MAGYLFRKEFSEGSIPSSGSNLRFVRPMAGHVFGKDETVGQYHHEAPSSMSGCAAHSSKMRLSIRLLFECRGRDSAVALPDEAPLGVVWRFRGEQKYRINFMSD